jgi:hypothetical protein
MASMHPVPTVGSGGAQTEMDVAKLLSGLQSQEGAPGAPAMPGPMDHRASVNQQHAAAMGMPPGAYDQTQAGVPNAWQLVEYYQQYMSYMCQPPVYMCQPPGMAPSGTFPSPYPYAGMAQHTHEALAQHYPVGGMQYASDPCIGSYNSHTRKTLLAKFHAKRKRRLEMTGKKTIRYGIRKNLADSRLRIKGRFVKRLPGFEGPDDALEGEGSEEGEAEAEVVDLVDLVDLVPGDTPESSERPQSTDAGDSFSESSPDGSPVQDCIAANQ